MVPKNEFEVSFKLSDPDFRTVGSRLRWWLGKRPFLAALHG
jgi:hypothetical protein